MSTGENKTRNTDMRLIALIAGIFVAAVIVFCVSFALPAQSEHSYDAEYGYIYSGAKSSSVEFAHATQDDDSLIIFGSSEFSTPASLVEQVPANTFAKHDYGVHMQLVGEAYDQSLWQAMALGAYAKDGVPNNKVVLSVGLGWFTDGGMDDETFKTRFSYALYRGFYQNPSIPQETKEYVASRLVEYGIDENTIAAPSHAFPQDVANDYVFAAIEDLRLRRDLDSVRAQGVQAVRLRTPETPDFASMRDEALVDAQRHSTNNDWGVEDTFYAQQLAPALDGAQGIRASETYSKTPEYDDLDCFLDIADACGIEVLVLISPVLGPYYDYIGIDEQTRTGCYDRIREICAKHGAGVADFTDKEYEKYFLFDIVHYGWTGWVDAERAIYDFANIKELR